MLNDKKAFIFYLSFGVEMDNLRRFFVLCEICHRKKVIFPSIFFKLLYYNKRLTFPCKVYYLSILRSLFKYIPIKC